MKPLVSILIPAYNAERWIAQTIRSALEQTWPRKEIIVVDDGSKDQTLKVAQTFASREVSVITQENRGAAATRNRALSLSQGEFLQWLDADDLLNPGKVMFQMTAQEQLGDPRALFSCEWGSFHHHPSRVRFTETPLWTDLAPVDWLICKFNENVFMQTGAWLVSRELSEAAGPWDPRLLSDDDGEYFCRVILESTGVHFVPEAKVFYRVPGPASLSQVGSSMRKLEALLLSMRLHIGHLRSRNDSPRVRKACLRYLQHGLPTFYPDFPELVAQLHDIAADLGGQLEPVALNWKYRWIQKTLGTGAARQAKARYNHFKATALRAMDGVLHGLRRQW